MFTNKGTRFLFSSIAAALLAGIAGAQTLTVSSLQGSSNGLLPVFGPGDTVTAVVTLQNGSYPLSLAWLVAETPIGVNAATTVIDSADLQGTFTIATTVPFGLYHLTAYAQDSQGNIYTATALPFAVEAYANSYSIQPGAVNLRYVGDESWIKISGLLPSGSSVDMTYATTTAYAPSLVFESPVTYQSLNTAIASVDNYGTVTGTGPGVTSIGAIVRYLVPPTSPYYYPGATTTLTIWMTVTVPSTIRGDLNGDGRVDELDLQILEERLNSPAITSVSLGVPYYLGSAYIDTSPSIPVADARDLNGDGVINALDARILVTLCTQAGCATQ